MEEVRTLGRFPMWIGVLAVLGSLVPVALAQPIHPQVQVHVYRVQEIDPIEVFTAPSFYYYVGVAESSLWDWRGPFTVPDGSDVVVDANHTFVVTSPTVYLAIVLCEVDTFSANDAADLTGRPGGGVDDNGCPLSTANAPTYAYQGSWDLVTETLGGDPVTPELGFFRSSGDFDGSTTTDENDANVWFAVSDDYGPPQADAGPDKSGFVGDILSVDGGASTASVGSSIEEYAWDFDGDGSDDALGRVASWTWSTKGPHTVRFRVTDSIGVTSDDTAIVTIQNRAPTADFAFSPTSPTTQHDVEFADTSTDTDGTIQSFLWAFGDGGTSTSRNPVHRFAKGGTYDVTLTVTDNDGAPGSATKAIVVQNVGPMASFGYEPGGPRVGQTVQFQDASTDVDGEVVSWRWSFGDGTSSDERNPVHTYAAAGTYNVTLEITDDQGAANAWSISVSVREAAPQLLDYWPVIVGILAVILLALVTLLWRRRRERKAGEPPPDSGTG